MLDALVVGFQYAPLRTAFQPSRTAAAALPVRHPTIQLVFDDGPWCSESLPRTTDEFVFAADPILKGRQHSGMKRFAVGALFEKLDDGFIPIEVGKDVRLHCFAEFFFHDFGIYVSDSKDEDSSNVAEDRLADFTRQLIDVLVRQDQIESVLSCFRENRCERVGGKILEFVDEQEKISALFFRHDRPCHRRQLKLGCEH